MIAGKKLMILGASSLQLPEIINAKKLGCIVYAVDQNKDAVGFSYADEGYPISTLDTPKVVDLAKALKIDGIMTLSDRAMVTVATVGKVLNIPTISLETAIKATNKAKMRQALKEHNVPIPKFCSVKNFEEYLKVCNEFEMPFIVKPVDNSGSRGIFLVKKEEEKGEGFWRSVSYSRCGEVIVEEYMVGSEVSVEAITRDNITQVIAVTDKITTGEPYFVEMGHTIPSVWTGDLLEQIKQVTLGANKALGIDRGPTHTEIKITKEGPKIVEVGARLGGDHITSDLVPLATGVNMIEAYIYFALGEQYEISSLKQGAAAVRFLKTRVGILKEVKGLETVRALPNIQSVYQYKMIGEQTLDIKKSEDRVLGVVAKGRDSEIASKVCEKALSQLEVIYE